MNDLDKKVKCCICNKLFIPKKKHIKTCSEKCSKENRILVHRASQEKYRKKNWEKIKKKNNYYFSKRVENDPDYYNKIYSVMKKNNPETLKKQAVSNRESIRNNPLKLEKRRKTINKWFKDKRKNDPFYKVRSSLSSRVRKYLLENRIRKRDSILKLIGCTKSFFIKYIESKFYAHPKSGEKMTWDNYGKFIYGKKYTWELDHIKPYKAFKDHDLTKVETLQRINHYSNLQPLWAEENRSKGGKFQI
jgi:hypothetical protein